MIHEITMTDTPESQTSKPASKFTCVDVIQASQDDLEVFEIVLGRQDGSIWHGCYQGNQYALEEIDPLTKMIPGDALGLKPVIDIKIIVREVKQVQ